MPCFDTYLSANMPFCCGGPFGAILFGSFLFGVYFFSVVSTSSLECPSCEKIHCSPRKASKLVCPGGTTTAICNCCPVCAKVAGERCGGDWNYLGKCDRGLVCDTENTPPRTAFTQLFGEKHKPTGVCQKVPPRQVGDEGRPHKCAPRCSPRVCRKAPKAICSAIKVAESRRDCHGQCQHTSCRACRFLPDVPDCGACAKDDFHCLRKFGKCMRRAVCKKNLFPCRRSKKHGKGKFICVVPGCPKGS